MFDGHGESKTLRSKQLPKSQRLQLRREIHFLQGLIETWLVEQNSIHELMNTTFAYGLKRDHEDPPSMRYLLLYNKCAKLFVKSDLHENYQDSWTTSHTWDVNDFAKAFPNILLRHSKLFEIQIRKHLPVIMFKKYSATVDGRNPASTNS